jgi:hypothetical protein
MRQVTQAEFFAVIGPQDVHPRVDATTLRERHHVSMWEGRHTRQVVGKSISDSYGVEPTQFFLSGSAKP